MEEARDDEEGNPGSQGHEKTKDDKGKRKEDKARQGKMEEEDLWHGRMMGRRGALHKWNHPIHGKAEPSKVMVTTNCHLLVVSAQFVIVATTTASNV